MSLRAPDKALLPTQTLDKVRKRAHTAFKNRDLVEVTLRDGTQWFGHEVGRLVWNGFYLVSAVDETFKPVHVSYLKVVSLNLIQI